MCRKCKGFRNIQLIPEYGFKITELAPKELETVEDLIAYQNYLWTTEGHTTKEVQLRIYNLILEKDDG